ncbi:hypothetical protein PR202_ga14782 [Eleusine coracana subsp. coracana]|uniref:Uncharacterized protein n=1 Tax=Eleusine coracana subsp. coracana TaxID=191504 RepID=A0AAV5CHE2_ELECO|nr:hypothetical protein PR202_ga14782 [Eleusine coracana subsp. coracana]
MAAAACRRAVSYTLRGPPAESLRAAAARVAAAAPTTGDAFVDMMDANFNKPIMPPPAKKLTENSSPTFVSSGDPCLDFFFHVVPGTPAASITSLPSNAWTADDRRAAPGVQPSAACAGRASPTARASTPRRCGCTGATPPRLPSTPAPSRSSCTSRTSPRSSTASSTAASRRGPRGRRPASPRLAACAYGAAGTAAAKGAASAVARRVAAANERDQRISAEATLFRRKRRAEAAARAVDRYARDPTYRLLHDRTADLFADLLAEDMQKLEQGRVNELSLAANCAWPDFFAEYDADRFQRYLEDVESGKEKIAAGAVLPHEIVKAVLEDNDKVASLQWERMVADMRALGKFSNCIPICDVSGSMYGTPLDVSVALGLLVSELSDEPWRHRLITFSEHPQLHVIEGETLYEKAEFIRDMEDWCMNTDFQAVFDKLLGVAVAAKLPPEKMVKRVIVFSDMEFDGASSNPWETDYEAITRKYTEAGYGDAVPEIVFWNLRNSDSVPVTAHQKGVALVSGFSKNLVKIFLDGDGIVSPRAIMDKAISGKEYEKLVVFD